MNYYLVDFENVRTDGVRDIADVAEGDTVIIFYSEHCKGITLDVIEEITKHNAKLSCCKVKTGTKNALDFQLSSHLGYLIGRCENNAKYHIVSNDKGYDCLCDYWKEQNKEVDRIGAAETIKKIVVTTVIQQDPASAKKKSKVASENLATLDEIKTLIGKDDDLTEILKVFNQYKTKTAINNGLAKHFKDSKKASDIYKKLKPLLKSKNKS